MSLMPREGTDGQVYDPTPDDSTPRRLFPSPNTVERRYHAHSYPHTSDFRSFMDSEFPGYKTVFTDQGKDVDNREQGTTIYHQQGVTIFHNHSGEPKNDVLVSLVGERHAVDMVDRPMRARFPQLEERVNSRLHFRPVFRD
jgi:hypothetical protein